MNHFYGTSRDVACTHLHTSSESWMTIHSLFHHFFNLLLDKDKINTVKVQEALRQRRDGDTRRNNEEKIMTRWLA